MDIRLISASNANMAELIAAGRFRADLYYRLNVLNLRIPPLTERKEDILPLALMFLNQYARQYHMEIPEFTAEDQKLLLENQWPGNVRALQNVIHRYAILQNGQRISVRECMEDPEFGDLSGAHSGKISVTPGTLEEMEKELIQAILRKNGGNRANAARELGISRTTLWKKIQPCTPNP